MASSFAALLRRLRKRYVSVQQFADALHIAPSRLSRAMGARSNSFDIVGCLKLAKVTGESADVVLRAAGKHAVADLLLDLYGQAIVPLSDEQQLLLRTYDGIRTRQIQLSVMAILAAMQGESTTFVFHQDGSVPTVLQHAAASGSSHRVRQQSAER